MTPRVLRWLIPACLFLLVFGFKLEVVRRYGSDLPRWDAFDAEGLAVYVPLANHRLTISDLVRPHNEHRIFWTKLLGLAELQLNGQWDARLQCTVNAALHSAIAVAVFVFASAGLPRRSHAPAFVLVAALFGLPLAWENPIAGFHSQQYFLLGFSFGAIALLARAVPWTARWWAGAACVVAALGTMGSGFFAAAIVLLVIGLQGWRDANLAGVFRTALPTVAVCGIALLLGVVGRVQVGYHEVLKATSIGDFLLYTLHCLQWPAQEWWWLAPLLWLPSVLLARRWWRREDRDGGSFPLVLLGFAAWVVLQILATAYTRGVGGGMPSSRYADTLAFGLLVNGLALGWLCSRWPSRAARVGLGSAWLLAAGGSAYQQASLIFRSVYPENRRHLEACEENVRRYLASGDPVHLDNPDIPYPSVGPLRERLDRPEIQAILPVSVRQPLALTAKGADRPFTSYSTVRRVRVFAPSAPPMPARLLALPKPEQRTIWLAETGTGEFQPWYFPHATTLRLYVAGGGSPAVVVTTPTTERRVDLPHLSDREWHFVDLPLARGHSSLKVSVSAGAWLTFGEPAEMATGSYWCWRLVRVGWWLCPVAAVAAALAGLGAWYCARREKALG